MPPAIPRISLRLSLLLIAAIALALSVVRVAVLPVLWDFGFQAGTYYGPHSDVLAAGQSVTLGEDFDARRTNRALGPDDGAPLEGVVAVGTRCIVRADMAPDEDSCYPDRWIVVVAGEGVWKGKRFEVPRRLLRRE